MNADSPPARMLATIPTLAKPTRHASQAPTLSPPSAPAPLGLPPIGLPPPLPRTTALHRRKQHPPHGLDRGRLKAVQAIAEVEQQRPHGSLDVAGVERAARHGVRPAQRARGAAPARRPPAVVQECVRQLQRC